MYTAISIPITYTCTYEHFNLIPNYLHMYVQYTAISFPITYTCMYISISFPT